MMQSRWLVVVSGLIAGLSSAGCAVRASGDARVVAYAPDVRAEVQAPSVVVFQEPPPLVMVEPDVYVVEDYDDAVYYTGGYYWRYRSDGWYHTSRWDQPWARVTINIVPPTITRRDHRSYVRFRARAESEVWREPRSHSTGARVALERHPRARGEARVEAHAAPRPEAHRADAHALPAAAPVAERERADRGREQAARAKQEREDADRKAERQRADDEKAQDERAKDARKKKVEPKKKKKKDEPNKRPEKEHGGH